jgi:ubiquinone/menaquinone biosynthesis C-methylase UbiE
MPTAPICDYEGSDYRTRFWEGQGRQYEDAVERLAIGRLLPPTGELLMDLGAGYGRLVDMYDGYRRVVLFDYSRSQLAYARSQLGDGRFVYVAGDFYRLPFVAGLFDAITQVRVIHHAADVPAVFEQVRRVLRPVGVYLLEFASKRHLKAIGRYLLRRQSWSPFDHQPVEFAELNFDFHPTWIREQLKAAGFVPGRTLTVSHFRIEFLKRRVPTRWLVALDSLAQHTGRWWQLTPSVFVRSRAAAEGPTASPGAFFACPNCQTPLPAPTTLGQVLDDVDELLACSGCRSRWALRDGIYDFKEPQT